jgi:hypothetical protein
LSRRTKNNPVLIGEPGVGKTAISEGWVSPKYGLVWELCLLSLQDCHLLENLWLCAVLLSESLPGNECCRVKVEVTMVFPWFNISACQSIVSWWTFISAG